MLMQYIWVLEQCLYSAVKLAFVSCAFEKAVVSTPESMAMTQLWMQPGRDCIVFSGQHLEVTTLQAIDTLDVLLYLAQNRCLGLAAFSNMALCIWHAYNTAVQAVNTLHGSTMRLDPKQAYGTCCSC